MADPNKVLRSVNLDGDRVCVDVFQRPDGTFGFDEFRRDPEDTRGWFSIGHHGALVFDSYDAAWAATVRTVPWVAD
tara:strand:+ start:635 stop:862 length:228 start_codon:yes stop_codon:yes gene_type:complete